MVGDSGAIPRFVNSEHLRTNPLGFLQAAESVADGLVVISENAPVFSRDSQCSFVVAIFGSDGVRQVLSDPDTFGTVVSAGEYLSLPPTLVRLNAGLFSMKGAQHRDRQQLLKAAFGPDPAGDHAENVVEGWNSFRSNLLFHQDVFLLREMRRLVLEVSERIIFGQAGSELGRLIQVYFDLRRTLSGSVSQTDHAVRRELIQAGARLVRALHARLATLRADVSGDGQACLLARISKKRSDASRLTDDELIAHANVLFMSSSEPIATALSWTLLLLSQQPNLRRAIRQELATAYRDGQIPSHIIETDLPLLTAVIHETLRLMPPSAVIVRLTTRPTRLLGYDLPARCEVVLSPYVAHRDSRLYPRPNVFDPHRWRSLKPAAFSYFPFGSGARFCLGKQLARYTLLSILARLLSSCEVLLANDQAIDWALNITFMPSQDPVVRFLPIPVDDENCMGGRLRGAIAALVRWK